MKAASLIFAMAEMIINPVMPSAPSKGNDYVNDL